MTRKFQPQMGWAGGSSQQGGNVLMLPKPRGSRGSESGMQKDLLPGICPLGHSEAECRVLALQLYPDWPSGLPASGRHLECLAHLWLLLLLKSLRGPSSHRPS